jgi:hypothetical protein
MKPGFCYHSSPFGDPFEPGPEQSISLHTYLLVSVHQVSTFEETYTAQPAEKDYFLLACA